MHLPRGGGSAPRLGRSKCHSRLPYDPFFGNLWTLELTNRPSTGR